MTLTAEQITSNIDERLAQDRALIARLEAARGHLVPVEQIRAPRRPAKARTVKRLARPAARRMVKRPPVDGAPGGALEKIEQNPGVSTRQLGIGPTLVANMKASGVIARDGKGWKVVGRISDGRS